MAVYTFVNGSRKRIFTHKPVVFINGVKHTVGKCYVFISGVRHQVFNEWSFVNSQLFTSSGHTSSALPFGTYQIIVRGAGGAGGESGASGAGGAGGKGELKVYTFNNTASNTFQAYIGQGGLIYTAGGNGGAHGANNAAASAGNGGGGGHASWAKIANNYFFAQGGGGGGGGAGGRDKERYSGSSGGAGGGGYYLYTSSTGLSIPGKTGGDAGGRYTAGGDGVTGNTNNFPNCYSQAGVMGYGGRPGGAMAYGGGASGGGGSGAGNHSNKFGGQGGSGAGGDYDAGGGEGAYNHHTEPTNTLTENKQYGVNANYGIGGSTNQNGSRGFVLVKRVS